MGWKRDVPKQYSEAHTEVIKILQDEGFIFVTEEPKALSSERGDGVIMDVLMKPLKLRLEPGDPYWHLKKEDEEKAMDERLEELTGIKTERMPNRKILVKSGKDYVLGIIKKRCKELGLSYYDRSLRRMVS